MVFSFCICLLCLLTFLSILVFFFHVESFPVFSFSVSFISFVFKNFLPSDKLFKAIEQQQSSHSVVSDSATPWTVAYQAPRPWNFPGKNTGVGCHFLLQIFPSYFPGGFYHVYPYPSGVILTCVIKFGSGLTFLFL